MTMDITMYPIVFFSPINVRTEMLVQNVPGVVNTDHLIPFSTGAKLT